MKRPIELQKRRGVAGGLCALAVIAGLLAFMPHVFAHEPIPCPVNLDVMLVIDNSASTDDESTSPPQPLENEKHIARKILDLLDFSKDRAGLVWYSETATLQTSLTSSVTIVEDGINAGSTVNMKTNQGDAIAAAEAELFANGRVDARKLMVLITDGGANWPLQSNTGVTPDVYATNSAQAAKSAGFLIYTVGFGGSDANPDLLEALASNSGTSFFVTSSSELSILLAREVVKAFCSGSVSGEKFHDQNRNGQKDTGEQMLPGWTFVLQAQGSSQSTTATSNSQGAFSFSNVSPGTYTLCEVQQEGWILMTPTQNQGCYQITLAAGQHATGFLFGNAPPPGAPPPVVTFVPTVVTQVVSPSPTPAPVLTIDKTIAQSSANPGAVVDYMVTIRNTGNATAVDVMLIDVLPAGLTHEGTTSGAQIWSMGSMTAGSTVTKGFKARVGNQASAGTYTNTAYASASNYPMISDQASLQILIPPVVPQVLGVESLPQLVITKTADRLAIFPEERVTYTITLRNTGKAPAVNVRINDIVPAGFATSLQSAPSWTLPNLGAGQQWTMAFSALAGPTVLPGQHENKVTAVADNHGQVQAAVTVTLLARSVLPETGMQDKEKGMWMISFFVLFAGFMAGTSLLFSRKNLATVRI